MKAMLQEHVKSKSAGIVWTTSTFSGTEAEIKKIILSLISPPFKPARLLFTNRGEMRRVERREGNQVKLF